MGETPSFKSRVPSVEDIRDPREMMMGDLVYAMCAATEYLVMSRLTRTFAPEDKKEQYAELSRKHDARMEALRDEINRREQLYRQS